MQAMTVGLKSHINDISKEKNIDKKSVIKSLENAYKTFARKKINMLANMEAEYNEETDQMTIFQYTKVVDSVKNPDFEITLSEAKKLDPEAEVGDELGVDISSSFIFSRNDITLIKQMFINSVQKEIKDKLVTEFSSRKGEIVSGIVKKADVNYYLIDLGSTEAYLSKRECIGDESFQVKDRVQALLTEVEAGPRGADLQLSRANPMYVVKLLEQEIPEVGEGLIEVTQIAREPGLRTRILLKSKETSLNPVQVVVGNKGFKIQNVSNQLHNERINVYIDYSNDPAIMQQELLKDMPLTQTINYRDKVILVTEAGNLGKVVGQRGSNIKTIAALIGKVIDVVSEDKLKKYHEQVAAEFRKVLPDLSAQNLISHHLTSLDRIKDLPVTELAKVLQTPMAEVEEIVKQLDSAKLEKIELKADAFAMPRPFAMPDRYRKSTSLDAEKRLRDEIRANFNIKSR